MTRTSEMAAAMFEEIKEQMAAVEEKIDDVSYNLELAKNEIIKNVEKQQNKPIKIENIVNYLLKSISGITNTSVNNLSYDIDKIISKLNSKTDTNNALITEVAQGLKKRKRLIVKMTVFQALAAVSILFNIYLLSTNQGLKDSELQLKYLKATNNVNQEVSDRLDTIFNVYRNEEAIMNIKLTVENQ